jgi:hypothetical protein
MNWMLQGGDTASISAVIYRNGVTSSRKGKRADIPPASGGSTSRGDTRRITQFQTQGDLPSQKMALAMQRVTR